VAAALRSGVRGPAPRKEAPGHSGQQKDARRMRVDACFLRVMQDPCAVSDKGVLCRVFNGVGREPCMGVPVGCNLTRRKDPQRTTAKVQHPILVGAALLSAKDAASSTSSLEFFLSRKCCL